jgi:hypothetical protein
VVRILRTVLIVFGPLLFTVMLVIMQLPLPEAAAKMILLVAGAWLMSSLILIPALLFNASESSPGPSDADGGGGTDPRQPPSPPSAPRGGIPLPDAEQARERVRDHDRPDRVGPRRRAREPERAPAQTLPDA